MPKVLQRHPAPTPKKCTCSTGFETGCKTVLLLYVPALVALASGLPQQGRQQGRQAKQLNTYGAPEVAEASAPAAVAYGAPEGEQADESAPAPALYGSPAGESEARAEADQATYNNADGQVIIKFKYELNKFFCMTMVQGKRTQLNDLECL